MKAIIVSLAIMFLGVTSTFADNNDNTSVFINQNGNVKEYVTVDKETSHPQSKTVYVSDDNGIRQEKIECEWSDLGGWVNVKKTTYMYDDNNKVVALKYTNWDSKTSDWSTKSKTVDCVK